jgi:hypothetical protein
MLCSALFAIAPENNCIQHRLKEFFFCEITKRDILCEEYQIRGSRECTTVRHHIDVAIIRCSR